mgnify:CR=1 FL=1
MEEFRLPAIVLHGITMLPGMIMHFDLHRPGDKSAMEEAFAGDQTAFIATGRELEEEDPQLGIVWDEETQEIHAQLMGEVEIEILKNRIFERFGTPVDFSAGRLIYKETIAAPVEGVGHFEQIGRAHV